MCSVSMQHTGSTSVIMIDTGSTYVAQSGPIGTTGTDGDIDAECTWTRGTAADIATRYGRRTV
jgi:hypothetical protein